jgi:hypothetical protein
MHCLSTSWLVPSLLEWPGCLCRPMVPGHVAVKSRAVVAMAHLSCQNARPLLRGVLYLATSTTCKIIVSREFCLRCTSRERDRSIAPLSRRPPHTCEANLGRCLSSPAKRPSASLNCLLKHPQFSTSGLQRSPIHHTRGTCIRKGTPARDKDVRTVLRTRMKSVHA